MSQAHQTTYRVGDRELIAMLALLTALEALAIDLILPAFSDVRDHFGLPTDSAQTARLVTFYFFGFAGQIFFGPIADRIGRLPVMRAGFALYIAGCVGTALAPSLGLMLAGRLVWGLGAGAIQVSAVAIIRDRFVGDQMARVLSIVLVIFMIVPIVAPVLGGLLLAVSSWRFVFLAPLGLTAVMLVWSLRLRETLVVFDGDRSKKSLAASANAVFTNTTTMRYIAAQTLGFAAFSSYLGSSERIFDGIFDRKELFVVVFASASVLMAALSGLNARLVPRFGAHTVSGYILAVGSIAGLAVVLVTVRNSGITPLALYVIGFSFVVGLNGMVTPNFGALALEPQGDQAGMAAAVYGSSQIALGAAGGAVIDGMIRDTVTPLLVGFLVAAMAGLALVKSDRQARVQ